MNVDKKRQWFEARRKKLEAAIRKNYKQRHDIEADIAKYESLRVRYEYVFDRPKEGRPGIWKGELGCDLFILVESARKTSKAIGQHRSTKQILQGLRKSIKKMDDHPLNTLFDKCPDDEDIRVRYTQDVAPYWKPRLLALRKIDAEFAELEARFEARKVMTKDEVRETIRPGYKKEPGALAKEIARIDRLPLGALEKRALTNEARRTLGSAGYDYPPEPGDSTET